MHILAALNQPANLVANTGRTLELVLDRLEIVYSVLILMERKSLIEKFPQKARQKVGQNDGQKSIWAVKKEQTNVRLTNRAIRKFGI